GHAGISLSGRYFLKLQGLKVDHVSAYASRMVELDKGLGGEGIPKHPDPLAIHDEISLPEIPKGNRQRTRAHGWHILSGSDRVSDQGLGQAQLVVGLPEVIALSVLEGSDLG